MENTFSIREYLTMIKNELGKLHTLNDEAVKMGVIMEALDKAIKAVTDNEKGVNEHDDHNEQRKDA